MNNTLFRFMILFLAGGTVAAADINRYRCGLKQVRQSGDLGLYGDAALEFTYESNGIRAKIFGILGYFNVRYAGSFREESRQNSYLGVFAGESENQVPYRPRVYKNHYKFPDFRARITSNYDGGGMWGYLAINKDNGRSKIDAHYVFQAGDHMGGTFDLSCQKL